MFAARAGARKVYGIECSGIANQAKEIIKVNGFSGVIEILHVKAEEATLPVDKVDIIISEWMGYFLFYESMLNSVLFARDKWLKPGGLLFPDKATLHISAIEDADYRAEKIDFWDAVYGFNMSCIKRMALLEPLIDTVYPESICSDVSKIFEIDINTVTVEDLSFRVPFCIRFLREDFCHALVVHFDITFPGDKRVSFSTGPQAHYTHWKQTVFYLLDTFPVCAGEELTGFIEQKPNKRNHRDLDIQLEYRFDGQHVQTKRQQSYRIR